MTSLLLVVSKNMQQQQQQQYKQRILCLLSSLSSLSSVSSSSSSSSAAAAAAVVGSTTGRRSCFSVLARSKNINSSSSSSSISSTGRSISSTAHATTIGIARQQQLQLQLQQQQQLQQLYNNTTIRYGHTVRVIITKDVKVLVTNNNPDITSIYASNLINSTVTSTANANTTAGTNENSESNSIVTSADAAIKNSNIIVSNATSDIPTVVMKGKYYVNDVVTVKAGYARNYLFPKKFAVYATKQNFLKYNIDDPLLLVSSSSSQVDGTSKKISNNNNDDEELKAADLLRHYLRNKTIKFKRQIIDQNNTTNIKDINAVQSRSGAFTSNVVREQLSKQLKIDLHPHEVIHFASVPLQKQNNLNHTLMSDNDRLLMIQNQPEFFPPIPSLLYYPIGTNMIRINNTNNNDLKDKDTTNTDSNTIVATDNDENENKENSTTAEKDMGIIKISQWQQTEKNLRPGRYLGDYLARITLRGGYTIPLKIEVVKR